MSAMNTRMLIQALPQYGELIARLGMHINMSQQINTELHKRKLNEIGMLEQVCGHTARMDSCAAAAATAAGRCQPVHAQGLAGCQASQASCHLVKPQHACHMATCHT